MYIERNDYQLDGWFSKVASVGKKVANVGIAPLRGAVGITRSAVTGKSVKGSIDTYVSQPLGRGLRSPGVTEALYFVPGVGPALSTGAQVALTLDDSRRALAREKQDSENAAAMDAEIARTEASIKELEGKRAASPAIGFMKENALPLAAGAVGLIALITVISRRK